MQPEGDSRCVALSRHTALLTAAFGVDKKMLPENPLKHEMKLLKFEHNKGIIAKLPLREPYI